MSEDTAYVPRIALDFDGVLHRYTGWNGPVPTGEPIPGALEACVELMKKFQLVIFTTRDAEKTSFWLRKHGFPALEVTNTKPICILLVDDRAVTFDGEWTHQFLDRIKDFRAYWDPKDESVL